MHHGIELQATNVKSSDETHTTVRLSCTGTCVPVQVSTASVISPTGQRQKQKHLDLTGVLGFA